tara:strand:+ start:274 stop:501 length:228 start_codon:yes stop_codon:yes gene_type:complete
MIKGGDKGFTKTPKKKPSIFKKAAKTVVKKGIKFAFSPLSLGLGAGTILYKGAKNQKGINFSKFRQFDKRGRKII